MTRMLYASPVWWGFVDDRASRDRLEAVVRKLKRQNFLPKGHGTLAEMCDTGDNDLFLSVLKNNDHVLNHLLPPIKNTRYDLRPRVHNRNLPRHTSYLQDKNYLRRMLYTNAY